MSPHVSSNMALSLSAGEVRGDERRAPSAGESGGVVAAAC